MTPEQIQQARAVAHIWASDPDGERAFLARALLAVTDQQPTPISGHHLANAIRDRFSWSPSGPREDSPLGHWLDDNFDIARKALTEQQGYHDEQSRRVLPQAIRFPGEVLKEAELSLDDITSRETVLLDAAMVAHLREIRRLIDTGQIALTEQQPEPVSEGEFTEFLWQAGTNAEDGWGEVARAVMDEFTITRKAGA